MRRAALPLLLAALLAGSVQAQTVGVDAQRFRLAAAERDARTAARRAAQLAAAAGRERDAAGRAAAQERVVAARVAAAETALVSTAARVRLIAAMIHQQQQRLAELQRPVGGLLAALAAGARRPAIVGLAQPGSIGDLVHVRASLAAAIPVIRTRTQGVRAEIARAHALREVAVRSAVALRAAQARLDKERQVLAELQTRHEARGALLRRGADDESDRALALGETGRDIVDQLEESGVAFSTGGALAALAGPLPRPGSAATGGRAPAPAYRLPVAGRLVTGFGELSAAGVSARGLTFAVRPGAAVAAPAGGIVRYAGRFRGYGTIVIVDHGAGWTSLIAGLGSTTLASGRIVAAGMPIGLAAPAGEPRITVELRRHGHPMDIAALTG